MTNQAQRHETEAWLGDNHGLDADRIDTLTESFSDISERYPDPDDEEEREAARIMAYRVLCGDQLVIGEYATALTRARIAVERASAALRQGAVMLVPDTTSEAAYARSAGVDRMTVRKWLGK